MPLTPAEEAAKAARIARDRERLDRALADPTLVESRHIYEQLDRVNGSNSVTANAGSSATDVANGIDGSADIEAIKSLIADVKSELVSSIAIADLLIQDSSSTPRYFVRQDRIDQTTGLPTVAIVNLDGTAPSPAPVLPLAPVKAEASNLINEDLYVAQASGTGYAIGDSVANVRLLNGETGLIVVSSWYNITTRAAIATAPPVANLKGYEDKLEELLTNASAIAAISSNRLANIETELGSNGDTTIPTTNLDPSTLKGLIRRSNDLIEAASPIDTIGSPVDISIPSAPTQLATLKGLDRGIWQTLLDTLANTGDPSDTSIPASAGDPATIKGLTRLLIESIGNLVLKGTPINGETIPSGSGFLGWTSWIAKQVVEILRSVGSPADTFAATDAGVSSQIGLFKRLNLKIQNDVQSIGQSVSIALARKTTITGALSTNVINTNLLDPNGAGAATDVRGYGAARLTLSVPAGLIFLRLEGAIDAGFTAGVVTLNWRVASGSPTYAATAAQLLPASGPFTESFYVDLAGINYIRLNNPSSPLVGVASWIALSQLPALPPDGRVTTAIAAGQSIGIAGTVASNSNINLPSLNSDTGLIPTTINTSTTTLGITPTTGISYRVEIPVTAVSGTQPTLDVRVQELVDGTNWRTVYTFERITATGNYRSPLIPLSGTQIRYDQIVGGTSPSFTRAIYRYQSNHPANYVSIARKTSAFNLVNAGIDLALYGRTRRMSATNRSAVLHYIQIHDSATPIVNGAIPIEVFQLPATSTLPFTVADLGQFGSVLGAATNPRVVISTTFNTYTQPSAIAANLLHLFAESL